MSTSAIEIGRIKDSIILPIADCSTRENEYWTHVSSQEELPKAKGNESVPLLSSLEMMLKDLPKFPNSETIASHLASHLATNSTLIHELRLLVGVSDKRLYLDLSYIFSRIYHPTKKGTLCGCPPHELTRHSTSFFENVLGRKGAESQAAARVISQYFVLKGLDQMLRSYKLMSDEQRNIIVSNLILPKEVQQNEAKRRGHGAEAAFAQLLEAVGCHTFMPRDKVTNPMGSRDPNVDPNTFKVIAREAASTLSFDLIILDRNGVVRVCVQGLIQSSDPGQFGVDKSTQTVIIRNKVEEFNSKFPSSKVELWGIVDGVGYSENKEGTINKMLKGFHEFIQMKSLYKAALGLHRMGLCSLKGIKFHYPSKVMQQMLRYVPSGVTVLSIHDSPKPTWKPIEAGHATIYI